MMNLAIEFPVAVVGVYGIKRLADTLVQALATIESIAKQVTQANAEVASSVVQEVSSYGSNPN